MKRFFASSALILGLSSGVGAQALPAPPLPVQALLAPPAKIEVQLAKTAFQAGEPVDLQVNLVNLSDAPLRIGGSAFENSAFKLEVRDAAGNAVKKTLEGEQFLRRRGAAFANILLILGPKERRTTVFRLSNLFDLSAGGSFLVQISRELVTGTVRVKANEIRENTLLLKAPQQQFSIEKAPIVRRVRNTAPFATRAKWLLSLGGGEIARFRVGDDGALQRTRSAATATPKNTAALVASPDGRFVYTIRRNTVGKTPNGGYGGQNDGAILGFRVEADGILTPLAPPTPLPNDFSTLALDAPRGRLISYTNYQNGKGYGDGGRAFSIGSDGKLTPQPGFQLDGTRTLALSGDGKLAFTTGSIFRLMPDGKLSRVNSLDWKTARTIAKEGAANEVWSRPNGQLVVVQIEAKLSKPGEKERFANGLVAFRIQPDAAPEEFSKAVPGFFTDLKNEKILSTKGIGFDPQGRFFLAQNEKGALLSFRVEANGVLSLVDSFDANQGFNYGDLGYTRENVIFDSDGRTFWTVGGGAARAFRLSENGKIAAWGAPLRAAGTDFVVVSAPLSAGTLQTLTGAFSVRLSSEVFDQGAPITLEIAGQSLLKSLAGARLTIDYEGQSWQVEKNAISATTTPYLQAGIVEMKPGSAAVGDSAGSAPQFEIALSRDFDLSRAGNYRLRVQIPGGENLELSFEVRPVAFDAPFRPFIAPTDEVQSTSPSTRSRGFAPR